MGIAHHRGLVPAVLAASHAAPRVVPARVSARIVRVPLARGTLGRGTLGGGTLW
jgi:hypothetical protein